MDPRADASQLVVTVGASLPEESLNPAEVLAHLEHVMGKLRCEVAGAISRKRAPKLVFRVL